MQECSGCADQLFTPVRSTNALADSDIRDIATYIAAANPEVARQFAVELWDALQRRGQDVGPLF